MPERAVRTLDRSDSRRRHLLDHQGAKEPDKVRWVIFEVGILNGNDGSTGFRKACFQCGTFSKIVAVHRKLIVLLPEVLLQLEGPGW